MNFEIKNYKYYGYSYKININIETLPYLSNGRNGMKLILNPMRGKKKREGIINGIYESLNSRYSTQHCSTVSPTFLESFKSV